MLLLVAFLQPRMTMHGTTNIKLLRKHKSSNGQFEGITHVHYNLLQTQKKHIREA